MAKRSWTMYCGVDVNFGFRRYNYPMSYNEILSSLGEENQTLDDELIQKTIKNFTNQWRVDWTKDDIIGWLMKLE
ncbi:hypothetical protein HBH56_085400 [Parastagonospora nodorum]|uniref:Uncharacterized protein n=2 Tax=Phaeosphaeria nodorum (strain SN15 / ATCC MYA-4574 / FGSC 10173) TaxID=321614 RepID=A0A7U2F5K2_PHANO|nr:hypothetical protein SNOG_01775 [Parastagonospora nodorum SN15]KAH3915176.1 hypothetical protein HBH56_085400 [Parastagonospora nodorum]EAT91424.1 hypothetical protein SNOG_01775 [Parastagonospora nodorum SN15]KAH3930074.1 hypothetical protein HBH54_116430 [Parastagonospora nodorum]KAH4250764.1 hypothetical protein HBI03_235580 [Parastagonospora nodorum]KAH4632880.1 hypothetical protein HBH55_081780 [Parastagonospora nodorum]